MRKRYKKPPYSPRILFNLMSDPEERFSLIGDLEEEFNSIVRRGGKLKGWCWYWKQLISSIVPFLFNTMYWKFTMFGNYLKITLRNLKRYKLYSLINVAGLSLGITCVLIAILLLQNELSFDIYHEKADDICQVFQTYYMEKGSETLGETSGKLAADLQFQFPEIINTVRLGNPGELVVKSEEKIFLENEIMCADPSVFDIFTYYFVKGDDKTALKNIHSIIFTEESAEKYFGDKDPIGKIVRLHNQFDFVVTGVIKNIPYNSHRRFKILIPFLFLRELGRNIDSYSNNSFFTYVLLHKNTPPREVSKKIFSNFTVQSQELNMEVKNFLVPLTRIRQHERGGAAYGTVFTYYIVALLIMVISCINYMYLSTARFSTRAKEVGVRKVAGALRSQLIWQFLSESIIFTVLALFSGLIVTHVLIPMVNTVTGRHLAINYFSYKWIVSIFFIVIITGIAAGSYPAFWLSSFNPIKILKGSLGSGYLGARLRKVLVIIQFSVTTIFIICIALTYKQYEYMKNENLDFNKENIVFLTGDIGKKFGLLSPLCCYF